MKTKIFSLLAAVALVIAVSSVAKADSYTDGTGDVWTVTITPDSGGDAGNVFDVTISVATADTTGGTPLYIVGVSIGNANTGGFGTNATFAMDPGDSAVGTGPVTPSGGCQGNPTPTACWTINPGLILDGSTYSWVLDVTMPADTSFSAVHVQATGSTSSTNPTAPNSHNLISQDIDGGTTTVPEPGSLMLFGTGLLSVAGFLRRKLLG